MRPAARDLLRQRSSIFEGQVDAAAAIAGTDRLVTVTGPAGTGKTTLLLVARTALESQGRRMVVVAPTKKAASVAGREIGATTSSLHALLIDHGFRFADDAVGRTVWTRLLPGETDPVTGVIHRGPIRFPLGPDDRIVVDESGMVDLQVANALALLAVGTGAGIAMIGDHLQALPVGHSGAMATMQRRSGATVELTSVHRFRDRSYGPLTLRIREPADYADATTVAKELAATGHVDIVTSERQMRDRMVAAWLRHAARGERVALVTATNAGAQQINDLVQQERLDRGQLAARRVTVGQEGQRLLVGDIVQTRRNDTGLGVDNRAQWTITRIGRQGIQLASITDSGDIRTVGHDYAAEHIHLAYATTVHGIQGETVHASYVGPSIDAAGLYVGMTRGRTTNTVMMIARNNNEAVEQLAKTMMRGRLEVTLDDARRASLSELGRAAREPGNTAQSQRPKPERTARDRLETARATERTARARLREIDALFAHDEAMRHARVESTKIGNRGVPSAAERATAQARIDDARREATILAQELRQQVAGADRSRDFRGTMLDVGRADLEHTPQVESPIIATQTGGTCGGLDF